MDFEWTCDEGPDRRVHCDEGEIIEFAYVVYDAKAGAVACEGQHYCRPERTPITAFCTELTGISEETLASAGSLKDAVGALERALAAEGLAGRSCCAVTHGSADLELVLPGNFRALGLPVPSVLQRYVDLREATQSYLAESGVKGVRASTLRQICEALRVEMIGSEHCGLDDSWMVLLATQQLLQHGAELRATDLEEEQRVFLAGSDRVLCLDGLPFFAIGSEVVPWLAGVAGVEPTDFSLSVVLGMDGRPSGRAVAEFRSHEAALKALDACRGGRRLTCGSLDAWPFEHPKERLILLRPARHQERVLFGTSWSPEPAPCLAPFPSDDEALARLRSSGKGKGKGRGKPQPAVGCEGSVKVFHDEKGYGFITSPSGDVFVHCNDCVAGQPMAGDRVSFDVIEDQRNGKMKAIHVTGGTGSLSRSDDAGQRRDG